MSPAFTDNDVDKRVETADGDSIGVVTMTDADTAYVDLKSGAIESIKAVLDWDGDSEEVVPIDADDVRNVGSDAIRLERNETTVHEDTRSEQRGMGPETGDVPDETTPVEGEGRSGKALEPETDEMTESGAERHPDDDGQPPQGDRTVTKERGEEEDR
ncbi:hypothetical protein C477_21065 [Haloterrigena salina JCM 13891]|uniref:Uncharacterized protein n=1 Tax=Haloterrigena salina JCM 13891 TaxID=1227488 RepID=M0BVN4_9EURY|nr:hypothetical protein [Haloterrigena salina]ELZ14177.1 hypothetical protein C477_21065 [Haloterrigena salina JCM 13891]